MIRKQLYEKDFELYHKIQQIYNGDLRYVSGNVSKFNKEIDLYDNSKEVFEEMFANILLRNLMENGAWEKKVYSHKNTNSVGRLIKMASFKLPISTRILEYFKNIGDKNLALGNLTLGDKLLIWLSVVNNPYEDQKKYSKMLNNIKLLSISFSNSIGLEKFQAALKSLNDKEFLIFQAADQIFIDNFTRVLKNVYRKNSKGSYEEIMLLINKIKVFMDFALNNKYWGLSSHVAKMFKAMHDENFIESVSKATLVVRSDEEQKNSRDKAFKDCTFEDFTDDSKTNMIDFLEEFEYIMNKGHGLKSSLLSVSYLDKEEFDIAHVAHNSFLKFYSPYECDYKNKILEALKISEISLGDNVL